MTLQNSRARGRLRLLSLREQTEAVEETMIGERARFAALERREAVRAVSAFNLFQAPPELATRAAAMLGSIDGLDVLEPSAGLGRLYKAVRHASQSARITLVEQSPDCSRELYEATDGDQLTRLVQGDFLAVDLRQRFDRVLMNPPFKQGRDIRHTLHARSLLKPGGLLVGMCYDGTRQNAKLRPLAASWEVLPPDTFKESGTRAGVVLFTLHASQSA